MTRKFQNRVCQQDWQGSVRAVTNANGFVVSRTDHQAFGGEVGYGTGQRSIDQGYNRDAATRQGYGLTERDDASGLDHTWFRKNENQAGRWTSPDPYKRSMSLADPQSFNRYSYVQNQPTNFVDPSGLVASSPDWLGASFDLWMAGCSDLSGESRTIIVCWTQNPWNTPEPGQGPGGTGGGGPRKRDSSGTACPPLELGVRARRGRPVSNASMKIAKGVLGRTTLGPIEHTTGWGYLVETVASAPGGAGYWSISRIVASVGTVTSSDGSTRLIADTTKESVSGSDLARRVGNRFYELDAPGFSKAYVDSQGRLVQNDTVAGEVMQNFATTLEGQGRYAGCSKTITYSIRTVLSDGRFQSYFYPD